MMREFRVPGGLTDLNDLSAALGGDERGDERDSEIARGSALKLYGTALASNGAVPKRSSDYLEHVERGVLLEAREMLKGANLRADSWACLPTDDKTGDLHKHLAAAS